MRKRAPVKNTIINTKKIVPEPPVVVATQRVVDNPPRAIERRHIVEDLSPRVPRNSKKRNNRDDNKKRVIQADAEITSWGLTA